MGKNSSLYIVFIFSKQSIYCILVDLFYILWYYNLVIDFVFSEFEKEHTLFKLVRSQNALRSFSHAF